MKIFKIFHKIFQSEVVGQQLVSTILALMLAPFSIYMGFEITNRLSRPIISIEYVTKYDKNIYQNISEIENKLDKLCNSQLFNNFRIENINSYQSVDFSFLLKNNNKSKLEKALSKFREYVRVDIAKTKKDLKELANKDILDKKILISQLLFDEDVDDGEVEQKIALFYTKKLEEDKILLNTIDELERLLRQNLISITQLNVSLLNKGSTDGLIRNLGFLTYEKMKFKIKKIPPPRTPEDMLAVRTFVTNKSFAFYGENAIGKIPKNTMSEFWFMVDAKNSKSSICNNGGFYLLELFDQDKKIIKKQLPCN